MGLTLEAGKCYKTVFVDMNEYFLCTEVSNSSVSGICLYVGHKQVLYFPHFDRIENLPLYENDAGEEFTEEFPVEDFKKMVNEFLAKAKESIDKF